MQRSLWSPIRYQDGLQEVEQNEIACLEAERLEKERVKREQEIAKYNAHMKMLGSWGVHNGAIIYCNGHLYTVENGRKRLYQGAYVPKSIKLTAEQIVQIPNL